MSDIAKILYVDDEPINLQVFRLNLKKYWNVLVAEDAIKALDLLSENKDIAIVVSDMKMPKMNGIEFIKKAKEKYPEIGYFILTGYEITDEIHDAVKSGLITKYFRKPLDIPEIIAAINKILV